MVEASFPDATEEQIQEGRKIAWLSYLGILFIVPLVVQKDNPYTKHHAIQGLSLFLAELIWIFFSWILVALFLRIAFFAVTVFGIISWMLWLAIFVISIIGIVQAATGKFWRVPVIGSIAENVFKGMLS